MATQFLYKNSDHLSYNDSVVDEPPELQLQLISRAYNTNYRTTLVVSPRSSSVCSTCSKEPVRLRLASLVASLGGGEGAKDSLSLSLCRAYVYASDMNASDMNKIQVRQTSVWS